MSAGWLLEWDAMLYVHAVLGCGVRRAAVQLAHLAAQSKIRTRAIGNGEEIAPEIWTQNLSGEWCRWSGGLELPDNRGIISGVEFEQQALQTCFPLQVERSPAKETPPTPRRGGGRVTQTDWDRIVREIIRRVHDEGVPLEIAPFALEMFEWCERELGADKAPGEDILRLRITTWLADIKR